MLFNQAFMDIINANQVYVVTIMVDTRAIIIDD
jgi:hypothetical protein